MAKNGKKNGAHKIPAGAHTFKRPLPCKLTDSEKQEKGEKGARLLDEADVIQDFKSKKNYLQVTCPSFQLPYIQEAMKALDVDWAKERLDGSSEIYVPMKFRDVEKVLNITRFYVSPEFEFHVDKVNNALFYRDEPALMGLQRRGIKEVDIPPSQMMLDVAIYEVAVYNNLLLGQDFLSWKNGPGRNFFEAAAGYFRQTIESKLPNGNNSTVTNEQGPFVYSSFNAVLMSAYVDFLRVKGKARLLNRGQVTAKSGTTGVVSSTDEVVTFKRFLIPPPPAPNPPDRAIQPKYVPPVAPAFEDPDGNPLTDTLPGYRQRLLDYVKSGKVGVQIQILPVVGQKSSEVTVSIDVSDVSGFTPAGTPIINSRSVDSKIRLYPGEPYVVAGLDRKGEVSSVGKVPILGSIPVVGYLFSHETESKSQTQIVVLLTPQVTLNAESVIAMPAQAQTAMAIINEDKHPRVPDNKYGFDQWLLDREQ